MKPGPLFAYTTRWVNKGMTSRLIFYLHKHRARQLQVPSWASVPAKQMSLVVHVERALLGSMA